MTSATRLTDYAREVRAYAAETRRPLELAKLMQVRLSLSKVGRLVCPRRLVRQVHTRSLGRVELRSHTSDISVLAELLVWGGYERAVADLPAPRAVLDLGANTGLAARWFLEQWPHARVVSAEPEPGNIAMLRRNLAGRRAQVVPYAVGQHRRTAKLHTTNREFAYTIVGDPGEDAVEVEVVPMSAVLLEAGLEEIDLLKVDIEGAEKELFQDCAEWISRVKWLVVECHAGYTVDALLADCERGGAQFEVVDLDEKPELEFSVVSARRVGEHA